ncbi:MAG: sugar ABC transporter permease [Burkholderiaceae bacterium]|nr:sugar ABC transporter permease [Burkholderiaceae bacterium]
MGEVVEVTLHRRREKSQRLLVAAFVTPTVLLLVLVITYPIAYSFYVSLHNTKYLQIESFAGFSQYRAIFSDTLFWLNVWVTIKYVIGSLMGAIPIGLLLAIILNTGLPGSGFFRTICALPWVISQTVAALLWLWLLDPSFGPINYTIAILGGLPVNFTASEDTALLVLIAVNVWMSYPLAMILLSAGLQTIPLEVLEAARIDGANFRTTFVKIKLPFLRQTLASTSIILTLYYFTMVTLVLILTGGGPVNSTDILSLRVFNETFQNWRIGYAAALGVIIFFMNAIFSLAYIRLSRVQRTT